MNNHALTLTILNRDFPEVAERVRKSISEMMPKLVLDDYSQIKDIVNYYRVLNNVDSWVNGSGKERITDHRERLIAVLILFYQPEKINGLNEKAYTRYRLVKSIADAMECSNVVISQSISSAISNYKIYSDFKNEVNKDYENIRQKHQASN